MSDLFLFLGHRVHIAYKLIGLIFHMIVLIDYLKLSFIPIKSYIELLYHSSIFICHDVIFYEISTYSVQGFMSVCFEKKYLV